MSASELAAWYAAIVATAVLAWDVVKYQRSGPQIKGDAKANWESYGISETEGDSLTFVKITNTGDRPTTLVSWGLYWYPAGTSLSDKKTRKSFIVKGGLAGQGKVPQKIEPGEVWTGVMKENEEYEQMLSEGTLMVGLGFSHVEEEVLLKVTKSANK